MTKLFTYIPLVAFLLVFFLVEAMLLKGLLLALMIVLIIFAKFKRSQLEEDVEFDDRVNANITKWSLRTIFILNTVLLVLLMIESRGVAVFDMSMNNMIAYLLVTLCVPFYIVPAIVKRF
ncbi:hypothetical protein [Solibacillus daqui]|uniref:hypothetical protein n=1 Tax=Solibacillus daqui TaxID=2912187 RepID=UPI0023657B42|nr:hypothetical protein [Solibacillus daqui]